MTEKIIIDGVDVAGCNDFYKEWDNWSGKDNYRCQDFLSGVCAGNNCYYKQFKQAENTVNECHKYLAELEDKIESLEQENRALKDNNNQLQAIIDDGRAENKRFREENKELKEMLSKEPKAMQAFQTAYSCLKKDNNVLFGMVKDYKMALEEIREIASPHCSQCVEILDKINGVLDLS